MKILSTYFRINKLSLNVAKSKLILFRSKNRRISNFGPVRIDNSRLQVVNQVTYLGAIIDDRLSWIPHINSLCAKISRQIGILRKLSFSLPIHILKLIYYSFIHCHITYCITAYGSAVKTNLHELQILQNRALKIIHKLPLFTNSIELYTSSKILNIRSLYYQQLGILIHNVLTGNKFNNFEFKYHSSNRSSRSSVLLEVKRARTCLGQRSVYHDGSKFFNFIPFEIKHTASSVKFKLQLTSWLLEDEMIAKVIRSDSIY